MLTYYNVNGFSIFYPNNFINAHDFPFFSAGKADESIMFRATVYRYDMSEIYTSLEYQYFAPDFEIYLDTRMSDIKIGRRECNWFALERLRTMSQDNLTFIDWRVLYSVGERYVGVIAMSGAAEDGDTQIKKLDKIIQTIDFDEKKVGTLDLQKATDLWRYQEKQNSKKNKYKNKDKQ